MSADEVEALARAHALHEEQGDFPALMETLVDDPVYEWHPLGVQLRGASAVVRYYERVRDLYSPLVEAATLVSLVAGKSGAVLEYAIRLPLEGRVSNERLVAVMPLDGDRFGGERIHSSEAVLRLLLGGMLEETTPVPQTAGLA